MKKIYITIAALMCTGILAAQTPANRTAKTIVADVLAQMPVARQAEYDKLMAELGSTGEEGVLTLTSRLDPEGKESDAAVEYALSGLTHYAAAEGRETLRRTVAEAYLKALSRATHREAKAFIIRQLQVVGSDECVPALAPLLTDETLCGPASRALTAIDTPAARSALTAALENDDTPTKALRNIVQAVGDAAVTEAEAPLQRLLPSTTGDLRTSVFYALSRTGTVNSLKLMEEAAYSENEPPKSGAMEAYINLLDRLIGQGETKAVEKALKKLQREAEEQGLVHERTAALRLLLRCELSKGGNSHGKAAKLITSAMKDGNKEYRVAALNFASDSLYNNVYPTLFRSLRRYDSERKAEALNWLRREIRNPQKRDIVSGLELSGGRTPAQALAEQLADTSFQVKQAAAWTLAGLGDSASIPTLASLLQDEDKQVALLGQDALASFPGDINQAVIGVLPQAPDTGKIAAIELLAMRRAAVGLKPILAQAESGSAPVRKAAYAALKDVVEPAHFAQMCALLESADKEYVAPLQQAVIATLASTPAAERVTTVNRRMSEAGSKGYLYYQVLASTHRDEVIGTLIDGFRSGDETKREAAFSALLALKNGKVADELYRICQEPPSPKYFDDALSAYIDLTSASSLPGEQRLLMLRKAMEIVRTDKQKATVLQRIEKTGTFLGMLCAGEFLDQKPVQQAAANAVMNIALAHKEYTGEKVRSLLNKVAEVLDNPDARYQKEAIRKHLSEMPEGEGFVSLFNGKDLTGWKGLVANPIARAKMSAAELSKAQQKADEAMRRDWKVENGLLVFDGTGYDNLCSVKQYGDFEMYIDWKLDPAGKEADAGVYLRGTPQVQIWDTARTNVGAQVGSGGLYNNKSNQSKPSKVADNPLGEWNSFYIKMVGDRVTVKLNGITVTDDVILENYWDRKQPIFPIEQIELQAHGSKVYYRDIYIRELERKEPFRLSEEEAKEGFKILFDGTNMHQWTGNTVDYTLEDHCISMNPSKSFGGNLYTKDEYANFVLRFDFQMTPGANNGVGIRTPMEGDAAYVGMELQILDCEHPIYKDITPLQHHGSVYGIIPAKPDHAKAFKPAGEWNTEEIVADGDNIRVTVNGIVVMEGNIREATKNGTADGHEHPGLFNKKGHIGFLGHGSPIKFRNIRIKELK